MSFLPPKKWAVVQDFRPFGYRIDGVFRSRRRATLSARHRRFLTVMPVDEARAYNRRMADLAEFEREFWFIRSMKKGEEHGSGNA